MMAGKLILDMPMAEYQALKALSAGGAHKLLEECPARYRHDSPWNPDRVLETAAHFDIGTSLHLAVLEPHMLAERIVAIPADTYAAKAARDLRDEAYATGKTPLKPKELESVLGMARAIEARPDIADLFRGGNAEVTLTWDWNGVPCKARCDYLSADRKTIVDAKTAESANPRAIARKAFTEGWPLRSAWYIDGVAACAGPLPEHYVYVVVEKSEPHLIQAYELAPRALAWGGQLAVAALRKFRACTLAGVWPGYGASIMPLELPAWAEYQLADRSESGEFSPDKAEIARAWLEP